MYKKDVYTIAENTPIAEDIYRMRLLGDTRYLTKPGQFVNIALEGFYLRRPISVCDWQEGEMTLIYKVVGRGTEAMAAMTEGEKLDILTGLGNGFSTEKAAGRVAVVGGGVGVPPLYNLTKQLLAEGREVFCVLGFNTASQVFYAKEFEALGAKVFVTTADGSMGTKGFVTEILKKEPYDYYFTCGPAPMLKAVYDLGKEGQLSFEERMGCGFGACMGCSCETLAGTKRICVDGPVMESREVRL